MIRNTANVSFYCRESKKNKDGLAPIELCLVINGKRNYVQLPRKENPTAFKRDLDCKKDNDLKDYLRAVRNRLNEIETAFLHDGKALTAGALKSYFKTGGHVPYTVGDLFNDYIAILEKRVGVDLTPKTFRKYELTRDKFYKILPPSEPVIAITKAVILNFQASLNRYYDYVTTNGYCQKIKTVVQFGIDNGKINVNPFSGIRLRRGEKNVQFLTEEEVAKIRTTDKLVPEDFQQAPNGMYYIHDTRNKTGVYYTSVILDDGVDVLRKYDFRLPMISNQKTNSYLKVIRDICGIDKPIFSHVARHTYATRCLNRGIRLEVVAKLLGHSTTKLTQHYAKLLDNSILAEVDEAFTKLKTDGDKK